MMISKICSIVLHFCFNFHHDESSSFFHWLSFIRRVQFAVRMTVAFLVSGFLAYGTALNDQLATQYLIPVMSVMTVQETFGMTLAASYQMLTVITPLSICLYIVQRIGLGYEDYVAAEFILLISSFFLAYKCSQVQTRKMALLINAIFFATIVNQKNLPSTFMFLLLEEFAIGTAIALIVSLLVFPSFATIDIENRVNYCLSNLQQMQKWVVQAFLCADQTHAQVHLARASTIEQMIRSTMNALPSRRNEARFEPSRYLQHLFNWKRHHLIDLTLQEQDDLISSLMFHVCSLSLMVKQCSINEYHGHFVKELEVHLLQVTDCQSKVVLALTTFPSPDRTVLSGYRTDLEQALSSLRKAYISARLRRIEHVLGSGKTIQSDDHLSHAFFLFQLAAIVRLLTRATTVASDRSVLQEIRDALKGKKGKKRRTIKQWLKPQWPRVLSAIKSMVIIGVGSIFVMVPRLAKAFENGQWILIALCMTQGDTVGGALTTMKMRLIGTLLGAMWAYVTYIVVEDHVYHTLGMLVPWILLFGYLKLSPRWNYAATVAAFTPILINLGRIPYGSAVPAGDFALLRIEENLVGIAIAIFLTIVIFPVFAIDVLKNNIQTTLQVCSQSINSMHSIYDQLFHYAHLTITVGKPVEEEIKSFVDAQRSSFHQLVSTQRALVQHAYLEPTLWWFRNRFSSARYDTLVEHQIDLFRMLHNIDAILMRINECSDGNEDEVRKIQSAAGGNFFLPDLHSELADLSRQLNDCIQLWSSYFALTQTRFYRLFRDCTYSRTKLLPSDLQKHEQHLIELYQTLDHLKSKHQQSFDQLLKHYFERVAQGDSPSSFVPYANSEKADMILIGISAMYYSTTQLVRTALALGTQIHTIFELEITRLYQPF